VAIEGAVAPAKKMLISAPYSGYIKRIFVKVGDRVVANAPIVTVSQTASASDESFPLRTPGAGTVMNVVYAEGEYYKPLEGDPSRSYIVRIDDISRFAVKAEATESEVTKIKVGQPVRIRSSAVPGRALDGKVESVALAGEKRDEMSNSKSYFPVTVAIESRDPDLKPGMSVVIEVIHATKENAFGVPIQAIKRRGGDTGVELATGEFRKVEIGERFDMEQEILSGLAEEEVILASP
jgi:multidrug efflux pump subunit AcrA (membrane-fusion protein)